MKIMVLLKRTPDTETKINISHDGTNLDHSQTNFIINPYDEFAIEEAVLTKEKLGTGEVVVCSFGPAETKEAIMRALAMGGDRGLLLSNEGLEDLDSLTLAKILKEVVTSEAPDLIFCGKQGIDNDNMHLGTMLAELMGWPHVNVANKVSVDANGSAEVEREVEGGQVEVYSVKLPAVIGANKALNNPRYTPIPAIIKAKRKPFDNKTVGDYGLDPSNLKSSVKVKTSNYQYPPEKAAGKVLKDQPISAMVTELVELLQSEAKVL